MKNKRLVFGLFVLVALLQWALPVSTIISKRNTAASGKSFCFKVRPVDPAHPFSGRYMSLKFEQDNLPIKSGLKLDPGMSLYLEIASDKDDWAVVRDMSVVPFTHTSDYIRVSVQYWDGERVYIQYPFEQFYMEENKAQTADLRLAILLQEPDHRICAMVKILDGASVLEDIFIDDQSISTWE